MAEKRSRKRIRDQAKFQSGLFILPSLFTVGNIFCGYFAVISTLRGNYDYAAMAIGIGAVLDSLDGRIARLTKTSTDFGVQLDSLADVITFGIAPAMLAFQWGIGSLAGIDASVVKHVSQLGWVASFIFVMCGALRLARFNIQTTKPETTAKRYFVGLPIPAAAGIIAAIVHFFKAPILLVGSALLWCFLILLAAFLMVSTVRYTSFKEFGISRTRPRMALLTAAMMIALVIFYSEIVLLLLATSYVSSGLIAKVLQMARWFIRKFLPANIRPSEPAHTHE